MKRGTKSLLFGVHQFAWHPFTVALAWRFLYGKWPTLPEWCAIIFHDTGYWGLPNLDGWVGRRHPIDGAYRSRKAAFLLLRPFCNRAYDAQQEAFLLAVGHSQNYCKLSGARLSKLHAADKVSILFEPKWFYLLRAWASGEVWEFIDHAPLSVERRPSVWFDWYRDYVKEKYL